MAKIDIANQAAAGVPTPSTGVTTLFIDTDKLLKGKDDAGAVTNYGASGNAISELTGEVTATGPGSAAATVSNAAVIAKLLTGLVTTTPGVPTSADSILSAIGKLSARQNQPWFPTATDGDVVISSNTTLVKDMYYNTLTVNSGATLFTAGFRVFALTSIVNNGTIDRSGNDASGITAGAALAAGSMSAAAAGGAGGTAAGTAGGASASGLGGAGGAGGLGSGGAGGAAGALTLVTSANGSVEVLQSASRATLGRDLAGAVVTCGSGGGGGGGDGTAGGGGGGAGGIMVLCSRSITGSGAMRAHGGNGGSPVGFTVGRGGGGGGGAGIIVLISENDTTATSLTLDVAGGLGASGTGTGVTGATGSIGRIYRVRV